MHPHSAMYLFIEENTIKLNFWLKEHVLYIIFCFVKTLILLMQGYGKADHAQTVEILRKKYKDYGCITCKDWLNSQSLVDWTMSKVFSLWAVLSAFFLLPEDDTLNCSLAFFYQPGIHLPAWHPSTSLVFQWLCVYVPISLLLRHYNLTLVKSCIGSLSLFILARY